MVAAMAANPRYHAHASPYWFTSHQLALMKVRPKHDAKPVLYNSQTNTTLISSMHQDDSVELLESDGATEQINYHTNVCETKPKHLISSLVRWRTSIIHTPPLKLALSSPAVRHTLLHSYNKWRRCLESKVCNQPFNFKVTPLSHNTRWANRTKTRLGPLSVAITALRSRSTFGVESAQATAAHRIQDSLAFYYSEDVEDKGAVMKSLSRARSLLYEKSTVEGNIFVVSNPPSAVTYAHECFTDSRRSISPVQGCHFSLTDCVTQLPLSMSECFPEIEEGIGNQPAQFMFDGQAFSSHADQQQLASYLKNKFPDEAERGRWPPFWITLNAASWLLPFRPIPDAGNFTVCGGDRFEYCSPTEPGVLLTDPVTKETVRWYHSSSFPIPLAATKKVAAMGLGSGSHFLVDPDTKQIVQSTVDNDGSMRVVASSSLLTSPHLNSEDEDLIGYEGWLAINTMSNNPESSLDSQRRDYAGPQYQQIRTEPIRPRSFSFLNKSLCRPMPILSVRDGANITQRLSLQARLELRRYCSKHRVFTSVWGTAADYSAVGLSLMEGAPIGVLVEGVGDEDVSEYFPSFLCTNVVEAWRCGYSRREFIQSYNSQLSDYVFGR